MLTEYERVVAVWRVSKNRTGVKDPKIQSYQIKEALLDPKTWLLLVAAACIGILNGGVTNFASSLIKGFGFNALKTSLLQTPGGSFELVFVILFGYLATVKNMLGATIISGSRASHFSLDLEANGDDSCLYSWHRWSSGYHED
jgi:hypothetical protein